MKRAYFVTDNLDELESVEKELGQHGIPEAHMQVLSEDEVGVQNHHLHSVSGFMQKDVVHQGTRGALFGVILAGIMLFSANAMGAFSFAGPLPFAFLAIIILGFSTWVGGFIGIRQTNYKFRDLVDVVAKGKHVFLVDFSEKQAHIIEKLTKRHPRLANAGFGSSVVNPFEEYEEHKAA